LRASPTESRPLPEALAKLVEQWNATGLRARLSVEGARRQLTPQADLTLYRAAQEALTNVGQHADASRVDLILDIALLNSSFAVEDDGVGDVTQAKDWPARRAERAQLLGGESRTHRDRQRFTLEVELPNEAD